jgi:polyphosphate kinase
MNYLQDNRRAWELQADGTWINVRLAMDRQSILPSNN